MPKRSPRIDLVNGPILRAEERLTHQTEVISEALVPRTARPAVKWLHDHGMTLKEVQENGTTSQARS